MKTAIRREFVPGKNRFISGDPAGAAYSEETVTNYDDTSLRLAIYTTSDILKFSEN